MSKSKKYQKMLPALVLSLGLSANVFCNTAQAGLAEGEHALFGLKEVSENQVVRDDSNLMAKCSGTKCGGGKCGKSKLGSQGTQNKCGKEKCGGGKCGKGKSNAHGGGNNKCGSTKLDTNSLKGSKLDTVSGKCGKDKLGKGQLNNTQPHNMDSSLGNDQLKPNQR